jgi:hypothetical protein
VVPARLGVKQRIRPIKPMNRGQLRSSGPKDAKFPRRRFDCVTLAAPEYLTPGTDEIWPAVSEQASFGAQYRAETLRRRQREHRTVLLAVTTFGAVISAGMVLIRSLL